MFKTSRRQFVLAAAGAVSTNGQQTMRILDPHVHVFRHDPQFPFAAGRTVPPEDRTPEDLIALMKANGVERTVIIQVIHYLYDNSYLASVLKQFPQYFLGVCRVNPADAAAPDHLSKLVEQHRFQGVRISPNGTPPGEWLTDMTLMRPLWKRCQDLKIPMTVLSPIARIPDVQKIVELFPDLTVVIDHMADCPVDKPAELDKLIALARYPKVFVKISHTWQLSKQKYPWLDAQEHVKRLHAAFGPQRLMWGTDWPVCLPHATYAQTLSVVRDDMKFLNAADKEWMLAKTIERVWRF
jgi:predicted TIM-barrel fold metal-dependent hydrolase